MYWTNIHHSLHRQRLFKGPIHTQKEFYRFSKTFALPEFVLSRNTPKDIIRGSREGRKHNRCVCVCVSVSVCVFVQNVRTWVCMYVCMYVCVCVCVCCVHFKDDTKLTWSAKVPKEFELVKEVSVAELFLKWMKTSTNNLILRQRFEAGTFRS